MNIDISPGMLPFLNRVWLLMVLSLAVPSAVYSNDIEKENVVLDARALTLKDVLGNWVTVENGVWIFGFYPTFAVVEGAFWDYEKVIPKKGKLQIQLRRGRTTKTIYAQPDNGLLRVGADDKNMTAYSQQIPGISDFKNYDQEGFQSSLIRRDSFRLSGILSGYDRKKDDYKYIQVIYNQIIEDAQANFIAEIDSLGRFSMTFPLLNPQEILLQFGTAMTSFYAVPGSNVMIQINKAHFEGLNSLEDLITFIKKRPDMLFMGNEGALNTEINDYTPVNFGILNPIESQQQSDKLDAPAFREFRLEKMNEQLRELEKYASSHHSGKRFVEYARAMIRYSAADDLLRYRWLRQAALNQEYFSFLRSISLTDERDVSTSQYFDFIREYSSLLASRKKDVSQDFIPYSEIVEKAIASGAEIDPKDKDLLLRLAQPRKTVYVPGPEVPNKDSLAFEALLTKYTSVLNATSTTLRMERRDKVETNLRTHLIDSLPRGIGRDIILGRMADEHLAHQRTLTADELSVYKSAIQNPVLYTAIAQRNTALENKLNGNVSESTSILSPIAASAKNILDSLISKYKGSVIYVDFWAPWCGPCMGEMPQAKILKQVLAAQHVTFLYLCVNCSEQSWTSTIKAKEIQGQHYRLNKDEFTVLSNQFQITSIPRYFLINREGVVVDENATRPSDKNGLIGKIEKLLK
jgi:thiol-disulfide isomerase/thioredoxin